MHAPEGSLRSVWSSSCGGALLADWLKLLEWGLVVTEVLCCMRSQHSHGNSYSGKHSAEIQVWRLRMGSRFLVDLKVTMICSDLGAMFGNGPLHRSLLRSSPSGFLLLLQPKPVQQLSLASSPSLPAEPTQLGQFSSQLRQLSQPAKPSQPTFKSVGAAGVTNRHYWSR